MVSVVSLQRTSTVASTTPLTHNQPQKDFSAAFANLQSQYGMSGGMPVPKPTEKRSKTHTSPKAQKHVVSFPTSPAPTTPSQPGKNYELAFGNLASSYGFGSSVPTPIYKSEKTTKCSSNKPSFASRGKFSASLLILRSRY